MEYGVEWLQGLHMQALFRCGRQAEALTAFTDLRQLLVKELGIEPSPQLRELHAQILAQDGGRAFVSMSLRPFLFAALVGRAPEVPALVVAGDDRAARDLAASLRQWLRPRTVPDGPTDPAVRACTTRASAIRSAN